MAVTAKFSDECDIVATLTPKPGKLDRVCAPPPRT